MTPADIAFAAHLLERRTSLQEQIHNIRVSLGRLRRETPYQEHVSYTRMTFSDMLDMRGKDLTVTLQPEDVLHLLQNYLRLTEDRLTSLGVVLNPPEEDAIG